MKKLLILLLAMVMVVSALAGCDYVPEESVDLKEAKVTERQEQQASNTVGFPNIKNYTEKRRLKELYELRDNADLICYAYTQNRDGEMVYLYRTFGFGINASIQYSNPVKIKGAERDFGVRIYDGDQAVEMPQAEPNNLFMPEGLSATYLMAIDDVTGDTFIIYAEPNIIVSERKLPRRLLKESSLPEGYDNADY